MPIRKYDQDPRTETQQKADAEALAAFEKGPFLQVDPSVRDDAIRRVKSLHEEQRASAAMLGLSLGELRRLLDISQEEVARSLGTQKSNISRVESGRHGGVTLEHFLGILRVLQSKAGADVARIVQTTDVERGSVLIHEEELDSFPNPTNPLQTA